MSAPDGRWPPANLRSLDQILQALRDARRIDELETLRLALIELAGEMIDHDVAGGSTADSPGPAAADGEPSGSWLARVGRLRPARPAEAEGPGAVVAAFAALLDATVYPAAFHDQRRLPRPKEAIIVAIAQLLAAERDEAAAELLRNTAHRLSFYQKGIGRRPLHAGGMRIESYDPRPGRFQFSAAITADPVRARLYDECLRRQAEDLRRFGERFGVRARLGGEALPDVHYLGR